MPMKSHDDAPGWGTRSSPVRDPAHAVAPNTAVAIGGTGSTHSRTGMRAAPTLPGGEASRPGSP